MEKRNEEIEIDLFRLLKALKRGIWLIVLSVLATGALGFIVSYYFIKPKYEAETLLYVNNSSISVGSTKVSISAQELSAAQSLVDTYCVILKSRSTLNEVINQSELDYTYEELCNMISTAAVDNTEVFGITVTAPSALEAEAIANTIARVLPDKISDIVEGSSVKIVDYAVIPSAKASPNVARNTVLAALVGMLLSCAGLIIQELLNDEIREDRDLSERYADIPILASVPDLNAKHGSNYGYYRLSVETEDE